MKKACAVFVVVLLLGQTQGLQAQQPSQSPAPPAPPAVNGTMTTIPSTDPAPAPSFLDRLRNLTRRNSDNPEDVTPKTTTEVKPAQTEVKPAQRTTLSTAMLKRKIDATLGKEGSVIQVANRPNGHLYVNVKVHNTAQVEKVSGKIFGMPELSSYQLDLEATIEP